MQEIIVNLQNENRITICICDHQARDLLACVDVAMMLTGQDVGKQHNNLVKSINVKMHILNILNSINFKCQIQ